MPNATSGSPRSSALIAGVRESGLLALGVFAYAPAVGILSREAGLSAGAVVVMTVAITSGTAQLVALQLLARHEPLWLVLWLTFVVNARHFVMAASLRPHLEKAGLGARLLTGWALSDESYALAFPHVQRQDVDLCGYLWGSAGLVYLAFYGGVLFGWWAAAGIPAWAARMAGLLFPFLLVALIARQVGGRADLWTVGVAGASGAVLVAARLGIEWLAPAVLVANTVATLGLLRWEPRAFSREEEG